ncbi:MAG: substrate-binding domain-containing protein [Planctomycetota bacterium]|jgi:DNA-binding LacI/PurR family transcriptional regulator
MPTDVRAGLGPAADRAAKVLRRRIVSGKIGAGTLVPSVRRLAGDLSLDSKTVWRALKGLEREGLVAAEPGKGFRVLPGAQDPDRGCPIVYVLGDTDPGGQGLRQRALLAAFQAAAAQRGWSLLTTGCVGRSGTQVLRELTGLRTSGVITDSLEEGFTAALRQAGIPTVLVDMADRNRGLDAVMQDGHNGGRLAARFLLERGHKRIAWFGPVNDNPHVQDRLGGVVGALCAAWGRMPADLLVDSPDPNDGAAARRLLSRRERPEAIVTLWREQALLIKGAADELGLVVGRDFEMVGWCTDEEYESDYCAAFRPGAIPPAVTWSVSTMAGTAIARLAERRENPDLPPLTVRIPTRLRLP